MNIFVLDNNYMFRPLLLLEEGLRGGAASVTWPIFVNKPD